MEEILKLDRAVDLAVVDHGFAGGAITAGLPTITVMDTNDPAPAVAKQQGANLIIIPMDDNRPPSAYLPIVNTIRDLSRLLGEPTPSLEEAIRPEVALRLSAAERSVRAWLNGTEPARQLIEDFANAFSDQFLQTRVRKDGQEPGTEDSYAVMAAFGLLRKLFDQHIISELRYRQPSLTPEELAWYFRRYTAIDPCRDQQLAHHDGEERDLRNQSVRRNGKQIGLE
jgi:hypothetical protein